MDEPQAETTTTSTAVNTDNPVRMVPSRAKKDRKGLVIVLFVIGLLVVVGSILFLLGRRGKSGEASPTPTFESIVVSPTSPPEETTVPEPVDKSEISILVQNGTGITGEAAYLQGVLKSMGFEKIEAGNASSQDNETTTVTFKEDVSEAVIKEVTDKLEGVYKSVKANSSKTQSADILIVTGLRSGQTAKPVSTAAPTATPAATATATSTPTATPTATP